MLSGASYEPAPGGLPDAGPVVGWLLPVVGALTFAAAMATVGWLLLAGFLDPTAGKTTVSRRGRTALLRASAAAGVWCVLSLVAAVFKLASILGIDLGTAVGSSTFTTYAWDIIDVRTLLICALLAAVICVGAAISVSLTGTTVWFVMAVVAVAVPAMAGHAAGPRRPRSGTSERRRPRGRGDSVGWRAHCARCNGLAESRNGRHRRSSIRSLGDGMRRGARGFRNRQRLRPPREARPTSSPVDTGAWSQPSRRC